ncbi:FkbM family methyltransferase [Azospirillum sp. sgz302134]
MSVTSRLLSMTPIIGAKFQRLIGEISAIRTELAELRGRSDGLAGAVEPLKEAVSSVAATQAAIGASIQENAGRIDARIGMLAHQLAEEMERMAAGYDANTARVAQQESEVAALRAEFEKLRATMMLALSGGALPAAASAGAAEVTDAGNGPDSVFEELTRQWNALSDAADGQRTLYAHVAKQYSMVVRERDALRQRANTLSGTLQQVRREASDRVALASVNAHLSAAFPERILAADGVLPVTVVDVGAQMLSSEDHVYARLLADGRCTVIGFEPLKDAADKRTDAEPGVQMLNHFIGKGGPASFQVAQFDPASSLLEANLPYLGQFYALADMCRPVERQTVETTRLDDIAEVGACDYLKIDVQGGELDVLLGAERLLDRILFVHSEVEFEPVYKDQPLFPDIHRFLRDRGFELLDLTKFGHSGYAALPGQQSRSKLLWADAIYVKTTDRLAAQGGGALLKAAYIAHTNYGMYDFAAHLIARHDRDAGTDLLQDYTAVVDG